MAKLDMDGREIRVGEYISWKGDIEMSGKVIDNRGPWIEVRTTDNEFGTPETRMVDPRRCWHE
jgi:hypothetical protein